MKIQNFFRNWFGFQKAARYRLIPLPLSPENLLVVVKEIDGNQICAEDLRGFFQCYIDILNRNDVPKPKSMYEDFFSSL